MRHIFKLFAPLPRQIAMVKNRRQLGILVAVSPSAILSSFGRIVFALAAPTCTKALQGNRLLAAWARYGAL
jgi:hypothetical protein